MKYEKRKIVMLPADEDWDDGDLVYNKSMDIIFVTSAGSKDAWDVFNGGGSHLEAQYLYVLSDEPIRDGWMIYLGNGSIEKPNEYRTNWRDEFGWSKIIASSDPKLVDVPRIPQEFIFTYGKIGGVDEIFVQYESLGEPSLEEGNIVVDIVTPTPVKIYTEGDMKKAYRAGIASTYRDTFDKWLAENY